MSDPTVWERRLASAAPVLLALAVAAFIALNLTIGLHPDDLKIIADSQGSSYAELWTSPFLDRFYRPIVVTLVRVSLDAFGSVAVPLRILQGVLIAASVYTALSLFGERVTKVARYSAALFLLASPLTFIAISQFAVGIGDLIVGLMFLLSLRVCLREDNGLGAKPAAALVAFSILALFSKESGLLVAAYCAFETGRRKQLLPAAIICAAVLGYLYFRTTFVARESFEFSTGYFFDMYSTTELNHTFGPSPARLYAYNVTSNLINALVGFPDRGQLRLQFGAALTIPAMTLTTVLVVRYLTVQRKWRAMAPLVLLVLMNAVLGYAYVRSRIMFVGAFSMSILFLFTIDDLVRREQRVLGILGRTLAAVVICLWVCVLFQSLFRLPLQAAASQ